MALTFQVIQDGHTQRDGSRYVKEIHSDAIGIVGEFLYKATAAMDTNAIATARAVTLQADLARNELIDAIQQNRMPSTRYATAQQMATYLTNTYPTLTGERQAHICWWINNRLVAGDVSDAQMQNVFGLTAGQWSNRKTNHIQPLAAQYEAVQNAGPV